jgi:hypothetical protein
MKGGGRLDSRPSRQDGFYNTKDWWKLRAKVKKSWRVNGKPCHYCGKPLDWHSKHGVVVDHIINRRQRPDLALDINNLCCVHGGKEACNTKKYYNEESNDKPEIDADGFPESWRD